MSKVWLESDIEGTKARIMEDERKRNLRLLDCLTAAPLFTLRHPIRTRRHNKAVNTTHLLTDQPATTRPLNRKGF